MSAHLLLIAVILSPFENLVEKYIYRHTVIILRYCTNAKMVDNIYIATSREWREKMIIRLAELPVTGDWDYCTVRAVHSVGVTPKPDVIVFPELFSIGFVLDKIPGMAISEDDLRSHVLSKAALEHGVSIVGGTLPGR
ncbi:MAG: hypothetical protein U9P42_03685, partial [Candidatus Fermentibacteria bacterium]|nr:hypothetical protein [Candidatus Fermentibacteria bacterium]